MSGLGSRSLWDSLSLHSGRCLRYFLACLLTIALLLRFSGLLLVDFFGWAQKEWVSTMRIKCKVITLVSRLKSIAYECVPLVTILAIVAPFALAKGHSFIEVWGGVCTSWAVIHYITKLCAYPYKQSNGVCGVNPNLESDPQKHNKGERMLHGSVEVLSVYALFMAPIWIPEVMPTIKAVWALAGYFI